MSYNHELKRPGFPVEGAKLHVAKAVDLKLVDTLIQELGLASTPFRTIHAGKTVLLPPGQPIEITSYSQLFKS
jgi:hypothetical protein